MRLSRSVPEEWMVRRTRPAWREVAVGVVAELLAEDEDAVERRAQLVGHVGQELGLVLRGEGELRGLLLERAAGLLDLLVLALDLDVLLGELLGLGAELLVGLLELALLRLELGGELLRLLEQPSVRIVASMVLRTMPMRLGELLEEGCVAGAEVAEARRAR
jgi:hypothetical protein